MLGSKSFLKLYRQMIADMSKGYRLQKDGQRVKPQSIDKYIFNYKLLLAFNKTTKFELRIFIVNKVTDKQRLRAKKYMRLFYVKFREFLHAKGHFDNYVGANIRALRTFYNYLLNELQMEVGYFHKFFYIPEENIPIVALNAQQLNYLIYNRELELNLSEKLQMVKDIFVVGCSVCLRISDLFNLQEFHLIKKVDSNARANYYLKVRSRKTNTETNLKLPHYAVRIFEKYKGKQETLLPKMSLWYFNACLKKLCDYIDNKEPIIKVRHRNGVPVVIYKNAKTLEHYTMSDHISSHTMRRTAITNMLRLGMPEQVVRKISGHAANSKEFHKYIAFTQTYQDIESDKMFEKLVQTS